MRVRLDHLSANVTRGLAARLTTGYLVVFAPTGHLVSTHETVDDALPMLRRAGGATHDYVLMPASAHDGSVSAARRWCVIARADAEPAADGSRPGRLAAYGTARTIHEHDQALNELAAMAAEPPYAHAVLDSLATA